MNSEGLAIMLNTAALFRSMHDAVVITNIYRVIFSDSAYVKVCHVR